MSSPIKADAELNAPRSTRVDILAIAAHRDDVEQTCGGTLLSMHAHGWRTGILDLTQGESGTRGTAADRAAEASAAARILNVAHREALDLPDGNVQNTYENRLKIASVLRRLRPRVVILPYWQGRHPDHYTSATLGYEAAAAIASRLSFPICLSASRRSPLRAGGRDPRTDFRRGAPLRPSRRCALRRTLCSKRGRPGG
jgi:LmbE family N-acetylglucosaminyl deacetylase